MVGIYICNTTTCFVENWFSKWYKHCPSQSVPAYSMLWATHINIFKGSSVMAPRFAVRTATVYKFADANALHPTIASACTTHFNGYFGVPSGLNACKLKKLCCFCLVKIFGFSIMYLYIKKQFWKNICWQLGPRGTKYVAVPVYLYAESSAVQTPTVRGKGRYI